METMATPPARRRRPAARPAREPRAAARKGVAAVDRALGILEVFGDADRGLALSELARRTGFYKSTILRLAGSLERFGYLRRLEDGTWRVGPKPLRLGTLYQRQLRTADVVPGALRNIVEELGEGASFFVLDDDRRICLHRVDSSQSVRDAVHEGDALPLHQGASGHLLLAFNGLAGARYDQIRAQRYAGSVGERDQETAAVSVPVFGVGQRLAGALTVSGPRYRMETIPLERALSVLLRHARDLTAALGGDPAALERPARPR
jgi:DNA-binding IclR family transcriptional regulator